MPIDIPITVPADEAFRDTAIDALWKWPQHLRYDELNDTAQKQVDRTSIQLRDAYIRGAHDVTVHYEDHVEVADAPQDKKWLVTLRLSPNYSTQEIIVAPAWAVMPDGLLGFGHETSDNRFLPDVAAFAPGQWSSVMQQPENNAPVVES